MEYKNDLLNTVDDYIKILDLFKKQSGVINGKILGWKGSKGYSTFEDTPKDFGTGTGTTGWCVSASEALISSQIFNTLLLTRNARAKLVSIDIKEQYWGECYNGSQNKWHTAILVEDNGLNFIIDITCRQFGNKFINKDIWELKTWTDTLRSPLCKHKLTDFNDNEYLINPVISDDILRYNDIDFSLTLNALKDITTIIDSERNMLAEFMYHKIHNVNRELLLKNLNPITFEYINNITTLLSNLPFKKYDICYGVLKFNSKDSALNWIREFVSNNCMLSQFMILSDSLNNACKLNNIDFYELNKSGNFKPLEDITYVVLELSDVFNIDTTWFKYSSTVLHHGTYLNVKQEDIFNTGKLINNENTGIERKTNTIMIKASSVFKN